MEAVRHPIWQLVSWKAGHRREFFRRFRMQVYLAFVQSATMMVFLGFVGGAAFSVQADFGLSFLGNSNQTGKLLILVVFRELTPLATNLILTARTVTGMASQMAMAKAQQEVEALQMMGIGVRRYLIAPRVAAAGASSFCMAVVFWVAAILGGWVGTNLQNSVPPNQFLNALAHATRLPDMPWFLFKTALVGGFIAYRACRLGLSIRGAPVEVPAVTNRAVIDALTIGLMLHFALSIAFYVLFGVDL